MDSWKRSFVDKLNQAQAHCARRFDDAMEKSVLGAYEDMTPFLRDNGFKVGMPLREQGRRSFKFELAENAYLLMIMRFTSVGEFEVRTETFVPGCDPILRKSVARIADVSEAWTEQQFRGGLDSFVEMLSGARPAPVEEELALV